MVFEKHSFIFCRIVKHNQNWRQLISPNLNNYFFTERWQISLSSNFDSNHQAKSTIERCNHTPVGPPVGPPDCPGTKVGLGGLDCTQIQFLVGVGCFSKITTEKYVERLVMKLSKYDSFLIWQKWTLCEERRATRIVTLIHVVNEFPFHYYWLSCNFFVSTYDTKREPLKQQGTLGVYIASVKHDGGQEKLFKSER